MRERRPLSEGLQSLPPALPTAREQEFVYGKSTQTGDTSIAPQAPANVAGTPISTRIRADYAAALKRVFLERQLSGAKPSSMRDILEAALEPWLKSNGYLP